MWKRMIIMLVSVVVFVAIIAVIKVVQVKKMIAMGKSFAPPPAAVSTIKAASEDWQPVLSAVGTAEAINGVTLTTDLSGIVSKINFESGAKVKSGDLLLQLDSSAEDAQLQSAMARRELAQINLDRSADLLKTRSISKSDSDSASAEFKQAQAAVSEAQATIARKTIRAPFDGVLGIRQANLGQYLKGGDPVAPLESMDPIYVTFTLPQQSLNNLAVGKKVNVKVDGITEEFPGEINAIDSTVDASTRNIKVQAKVKNPDEHLRPGMFVNVDVLLPQDVAVVTIPSSAINYAPYGDSVFVIAQIKGDDGVTFQGVEQRVVKLGTAKGDQVAILSGLKANEEIVTSGVFKLRNKAPIQINNSIQPSNLSHPTPADS